MRGPSLRTIRNRVDRLSAECQVHREPIFLHWMDGYEQCPSCGYDLGAHSRAAALAGVQDDCGLGVPAPTFIWYSLSNLATCPACKAGLLDQSMDSEEHA